MAETIKIPKLGLTMEKGILSKWHVSVGQQINKGDILFELETDKISNDIECPVDGVVLDIMAEEGAEIPVYEAVCIIGAENEAPEPVSKANTVSKVEVKKEYMSGSVEKEKEKTMKTFTGRPLISPYAKKLADEFSVDYLKIEGSGPNGRIIKTDVLKAIDDARIFITPLARTIASKKGIDINNIAGSGPNGRINRDDVLKFDEDIKQQDGPASISRTFSDVPETQIKDEFEEISANNIRKIIANRLTRSKQNIPHVYFKTTINASALKNKRDALQKKVSYNDLIIKALANTIAEFPMFNSFWQNNTIYQRGSIHIGFAVNLEKGLIVPVVKNAFKSLRQISNDTQKLIHDAREGKLSMDKLEGACFTLSNLGGYDVDEFYAIINPGESGILAIGKIQEKVFAQDGKIGIRQEIALNLTVDHRIIDGAVAGAFLTRLKQELEQNINDYTY